MATPIKLQPLPPISAYKGMNQDQVDEIEALKAIYEEDFRIVDEREKSLRIIIRSDNGSLSMDMVIHYPDDYPEVSPPIYEIKNAYWIGSEGQQHIHVADRLMELYDEGKGPVVLYQWIEAVREFLNQKASELHSDLHGSEAFEEEDDNASASLIHPEEMNKLEKRTPDGCSGVCPLILHGDPLTDRKSTFQAHAAEVKTTEEVKAVLSELKTNKKIATAAHNILAYRLHDESRGVFQQDCDDDGETAAGGRLLHLLQIMDVRNVMVVVTRWFGGILLHADRFKHINNVARILLQETGLGQKHKPEAVWSGKAKGQSKTSARTK